MKDKITQEMMSLSLIPKRRLKHVCVGDSFFFFLILGCNKISKQINKA